MKLPTKAGLAISSCVAFAVFLAFGVHAQQPDGAAPAPAPSADQAKAKAKGKGL